MRSYVLAATLCLVALPAWANSPTDARSLGMGNAFTAVADDANGPAWNPAGLTQTKFSLYLPTQIGLYFGNNTFGVTEFQKLGEISNYWSSYSTNFATAQGAPSLPDKIREGDFRAGLDARMSLFGLSFGVPSPFQRKEWLSLGISSSLNADASSRFYAPTFMEALNSAYQGIVPADRALAESINAMSENISGNSPSPLVLIEKVGEMAQEIDTALGPLLDNSNKSIDLTLNAGTYATTMVSAAHPVKIKWGRKDEIKITVGSNLKVFSSIDPMAMTQGSTNLSQYISGVDQPIGLPSTLKLSVSGNLGPAYDAFKLQVAEFQKNPTAEALSQFKNAGDTLLNNVPMSGSASYTKATGSGVGCDLGAMARINDQTTIGMALINPVVIWPAVQTTFRASWDGQAKKFVSDGTSTSTGANYRETEPAAFRVGASYYPRTWFAGFRLAADLEKEFTDIPWAARVGGEGSLGPLALRLGTQLGGTGNMVTGGLGLNLWALKLNLGAGIDYGLRNASGAFSTTLCF